MSLHRDRGCADAAAANLSRHQQKLGADTRWIQACVVRYRPALLVASGLLAGILFGRLKTTRVLRALFSTANFSAAGVRSTLGWISLLANFGMRDTDKHHLPARTDTQG